MARQRNYAAEYAKRKANREARLRTAGLPYMSERAERKFRKARGAGSGRTFAGYYGPTPAPRNAAMSSRYVDAATVERMNRDNMAHVAKEARRIAALKKSDDKRTNLNVQMAKYVNFYDTTLGNRIGDYSEERVAYVTDYYSAVTSVAKNEASYAAAKRSGASRDLVRKALRDHRSHLVELFGSDLLDIYDAGYSDE